METSKQTVGLMNRMGRIFLSVDLQQRCWDFAKELRQHYLDIGQCTEFTVESNIEALAFAKMAECTYCVYEALPVSKLHWNPKEADLGWDVPVTGVGKVDVKWTRYGSRLVWPKPRNHVFHQRVFDVLVLVHGDDEIGFLPTGWLTKAEFWRKHRLAGPNYVDKLSEGTWFVPGNELEPMIDLHR